MTSRARHRRAAAGSVLAAGLLVVLTAPVASAADGPGYGGTAAGLDVRWEPAAAAAGATTPPVTVDPSGPGTATSPTARTPAAAPTISAGPTATPTTGTATTSTPSASDQAVTAAASDPSASPADVVADPGTATLTRVALTSVGGGARTAGAHLGAATPQLAPDVLDLTVRGLGFRARSAVTVRLGGSGAVVVRTDTAGTLAVAIDGSQLRGTDPGVSVMAVGRNPSGTEVVLLGSVPPTPGGPGPMLIVPWAALAVVLLGLGVAIARPRPADPVARHGAPTAGRHARA